MAGIFNGPPRGGTRGGRSEFSWDNVKADQSREYYLGHSVKAVTGRWAKGKDVYWYTRDKEEGAEADARRENEMKMVKQREQDLMMEALGMKPKAPKHETRQPRLDQEDMKKLLGKDQDEDQNPGAGPSGGEGDRIRGLGYNASRTTGTVQSGVEQERLDGMGMRSGPDMLASNRNTAAAAAAAAAAPPTGEDEIKRYKEEKKASKRDKKDSRKEKERSSSSRKDSRKEKKRRRHSRSRSRSPDSSSSPERQRRRRERRDRSNRDRDDGRIEYSEDSRDRKIHRKSRRRSPSRSPVENSERRRRDGRSRSQSRERRRH